jgi:hypothetical protein
MKRKKDGLFDRDRWYQSARQRLDPQGEPIIGMAMGVEIDRIQYQCEWKGQGHPPDSDIRLLRESRWYQESQNVWATPLVKHGQSSDWTRLGELPDPDGGDPIPINNYYAQHPDHILGILDRKSKLYRPDESKNYTIRNLGATCANWRVGSKR